MNSTNLKLLRDELMVDEGTYLKAYKDSLGNWTIGIGHLLGGSPRMTTIVLSEAVSLLNGDIEAALVEAVRCLPELKYWATDDPQFRAHNQSRARAVVNMAFNLGAKLEGFVTFLKLMRGHEWQAAAEDMMTTKWAKEVPNRARRLHNMILTDD